MKGIDFLKAHGLPIVKGDLINDMELPQKSWQPLQYASGYSLDLYCDQRHERRPGKGFVNLNTDLAERGLRMQTYTGENFTQCARDARADGWQIHPKTRTATCPSCAGTKRKR